MARTKEDVVVVAGSTIDGATGEVVEASTSAFPPDVAAAIDAADGATTDGATTKPATVLDMVDATNGANNVDGDDEKAEENGEGEDREETIQERFHRVAGSRVSKALKAIEVIGNCADPKVYGYTPEQIAKMLAALRAAVDKLDSSFRKGSVAKKTQAGFFD